VTASPPSLASLRIDRDPPRTSSSGSGSSRLLIAIVVLIVGGGVAWFVLAPRAQSVSVALAEASGGGTMSSAGISANGYVVARTKASVSAKIPGRLEYLGVSEGSRVKLGDIMARIESGDYAAALANAQATLAQYEAQLAQAKRSFARAQSLRKDGLNSVNDLEDASTQVEVLTAQVAAGRAQVRLAEVNLENTRVRRRSTTILRKDAEVGEIVAPSSAGSGLTRTAIVTIADPARSRSRWT
jgi:RND family efflux transporter MFP subunit